MANNLGKAFGVVPLFDPAEGMLVRSPLGNGPGWWAGAPSATFDPTSNTFYLAYRLRQPHEQERGVECRIASSVNGIGFTDIWALPKGSLDVVSLGRASLLRGLDLKWRLYLSYVDPSDRRWYTGYMEADEPDRFDPATFTRLLSPALVRSEGVRDPNAVIIGRMVYLFASYAVSPPDLPAASGSPMPPMRARSGAAMSADGRRFQWLGDVSPVASDVSTGPDELRWDDYCCRLSALLPLDTGGFLAFYDGGTTAEDNYEEKTGLAVTFDLRSYLSLSPERPTLVSPYGSGSLRYVDVLPVGMELFYYYEICRPDGAHELRVSVVERD